MKRKEFVLTDEQYDALMEASKPTPVMYGSGGAPLFESQQARANRAWMKLGLDMGFDAATVQPVSGKSNRYFTAEVFEEPKEVEMPYHGYVEVEVRLLRQGHGADSSGDPGSGYAVEQSKTVRIEERDAHAATIGNDVMVADKLGERVVAAIREVLDADESLDLEERWSYAVERATPESKRKALELLEGRSQ